jgi:hypothetical protein
VVYDVAIDPTNQSVWVATLYGLNHVYLDGPGAIFELHLEDELVITVNVSETGEVGGSTYVASQIGDLRSGYYDYVLDADTLSVSRIRNDGTALGRSIERESRASAEKGFQWVGIFGEPSVIRLVRESDQETISEMVWGTSSHRPLLSSDKTGGIWVAGNGELQHIVYEAGKIVVDRRFSAVDGLRNPKHVAGVSRNEVWFTDFENADNLYGEMRLNYLSMHNGEPIVQTRSMNEYRVTGSSNISMDASSTGWLALGGEKQGFFIINPGSSD